MLIAEIGNNHFGSFKKAKELIKAAHNSGADLIKAQAFKAIDIKSGSMPKAFYEQCQFLIPQYIELIEYARDLGNDLFYSIFSDGMHEISMHQNWHKIAGSQVKQELPSSMADIENMIISIPTGIDLKSLYKFKEASLLYVSEYLTDQPDLEYITFLSAWLGRQVGYSDHTIGIKKAVDAYQLHGAHIIEKHFCLKKDESYRNVVFRDTIHGATPAEFEKLAKAVE